MMRLLAPCGNSNAGAGPPGAPRGRTTRTGQPGERRSSRYGRDRGTTARGSELADLECGPEEGLRLAWAQTGGRSRRTAEAEARQVLGPAREGEQEETGAGPGESGDEARHPLSSGRIQIVDRAVVDEEVEGAGHTLDGIAGQVRPHEGHTVRAEALRGRESPRLAQRGLREVDTGHPEA